MADLGNLYFGVHLKDYTDAEADKVKKKLENLSVKLTIDGSNVNISHTDLIKKQIEDAIKNVSVQSVSINANALKTQLNAAFQSAVPQVSVTLLKGTLGNDLQTYLNSKVFTVSISITQGNAQNAVNTAFANVSVPVNVTVKASAVIQQLQQSLANRNVKVGVEAKNVNDFITDLEKRLKNKKIKIDVEANQQSLIQSVRQAFQGQSIKAQVKVDVDAQAITNAVQSAINNARFTYNPNGGRQSTGGNQRYNTGHWGQNSSNGLYQTARASVTLGRSLSTNIRLAGELGTSLGNLASVFGIKDILKGVVEIGGQLENQRIALGAILQDGGKATEMFSRIQSLAVKSPYGIMDLNQYTKQLSAYGIEYNELYETMKRMADISAGVGVNMGRIILAFGQVKAAGFLKGTELRQFTEANIPMVEKLAERFSTLEKRIVSAGEVYDMISKKKVTFEDVKSVLWDLTGEGGMFNNMQEVLSESLASKWKNLADAIDVMYGKIADGKIGGWLKSLAEGLTELTKNWEYLATAIGVAAGAYGAFKLGNNGVVSNTKALYDSTLAMKRQQANSLLLTKTYRELTRAEQQLVSTTGRLTIADTKRLIRTGQLNRDEAIRLIGMKKLDAATEAYIARLYGLDQKMITTAKNSSWLGRSIATLSGAFRSLGATLKGLFLSPWTWITVGIGAISEWAAHYYKQQAEIEERNKNFAESTKGAAESLERELLKMKDLDISSMNTDEMKIKVKEMTTTIQNEADGWQAILSEIFAKEADGTFKNSVEEQLKLLKAKMEELAEAKKKLMGDDDSYSDVIGETETGVLFWKKDVIDRVKEYSQAVEENDKKLKDLAIHARDVSTALTSAVSGNSVIQKVFEGKGLNEQVAILRDYKNEWSKFVVELTKSNPKAAQIVNEWFNSIDKYFVKGKESEMIWDFTLARDKMIGELKLQDEEVGKLTEYGQQYVTGFVGGLIKEAAVQKPIVQQYIYDWFTGQFGLPRVDLGYLIPSVITNIGGGADDGSKKDAVAELWKKRVAEIEKAIKMYDKWKKIEGRISAENRVKSHSELANLFNGSYGFSLDLESPTDAYKYIQKLLDESKEKQKELMVNLGVKISDAEFKDAQDKLKANMELLKREAEKTIQGWDLYKKLFEATGDKGVSMKIAFGENIGFKDKLEHLRSQIEVEMGKIGATIPFERLIGMDTKDLESKGLGGLSDLIEKYNRENAKLKEESVKNFIDIIEASKDFAAQIEDIERNLEKDLKDLRANANGADTSRAEAQLRKNAAEAISKVNFEEFKQSSDWIRVFDDLNRVSDATLDNMITKIEEFAKQGRMSEEVTKQIVDAMAKLRKETIDRNPFEGFEDAWKRLRHFKGLRSMVGEYDEHGKLITQQMADGGIAEANDDLEKSALAVADKFQAAANAADLLGGLFENLGLELGGLGDILGGTASGAQTGAGIASALGVAGPWGAIAGAAVGMLSSVFAMHDKALQKEIEASQSREKLIKSVASNLENTLNNKLGGIFTISLDAASKKQMETLMTLTKDYEGRRKKKELVYSDATRDMAQEALNDDSYYKAQKALLMAQIDELKNQKKAEEDKKNEDQVKIADYELAIAEMEGELEMFAQDMMNAIYGIDFKDWARQFTDAIIGAWASGEDAAEAYKNTVSDVMRNVAASVIQQGIIGKWLEENMRHVLELFSKNDGKITSDVYSAMADLAAGVGGKIEETESFLEAWEKLLNEKGYSMKDLVSASGGSLSKGIQSVTEDTANLLGSYLNSIRQSVHVKQQFIEKLVSEDIPKINYLAEAQLRELSQIQANTARNVVLVGEIRDLMNRVVDKGSNKLKV